ncbi:MAG: glucose PTS transporter subunit IIA [Ancrocorticia sp.]|jgi:PTS system beta-glucosides-specific IIC component|nr:glucose PTS transporter subunit IIA [Ancrocorticia sp.]MCI2028785.1 glucose PTS transporter subunit IIA [Ancrocorticia sp.]
MSQSPALAIVQAVGGPHNIVSLTHCATRLRFQLKDAGLVDKDAVENVDGVMGSVPQSGERFQVIIGGAVATMYSDIMALPEMHNVGSPSADDVKAAVRARGPRGTHAWVDSFFEYLSDSFRPILGVLLGASLIIAFAAVMDALGVQDFRADVKPPFWTFLDAMWRSVFYFLPIMVAYNAAKKLNVDGWLGGAIMAALMTPNFASMSSLPQTVCHTNDFGASLCQVDVLGISMQLSDYGGQVFVPLIMVAVLAPLYHGLQKVISQNLQLVFVPFISMAVMIPLTAFLLGPLGIWIGNAIGNGLGWLNNAAPIIFAILIPMLYPFLVPLGLHWPLNAIMLVNINTLGYDFIQGPMGAWNFACFGATAGVMLIAIKEKDTQMKQTSIGALIAGLFGGISEPSLYGIHLRYARIYPRMLIGCFVGGLVQGIGAMVIGTGVRASAFAFTSLLTIPVFSPMWLYGLSIAAAFIVAMSAVVITDYRTPEQKEEIRARIAAAHESEELPQSAAPDASGKATAVATAPAKTLKPAMVPGAVTEVLAPMAGTVIPLEDVPDEGFASGAVGKGVAIRPTSDTVVAPGDGKVILAFPTGHAVGIRLDNGIEVLIHIGIDTVNLQGKGFTVHVSRGERVRAGDPLVTFDRAVIHDAGYSTVTPVLVTNHRKFAAVTQDVQGTVQPGDKLLTVTARAR